MISQTARLFRKVLAKRFLAPAISISVISHLADDELEKPEHPLSLEKLGEKWSHRFVLQQSSVTNVESASVTLTQTVIALESCCNNYCQHLSELTRLLSLTGDGLPIAYTSQEIYDRVVTLRSMIKEEKNSLIELTVLYSYVRKLMNSVAETAYLVGAEYASIQASSRLAAADRKIEEDLARSTICEKDLLAAEKDNVIRVGKETTNNNIDPEFVQEEMKKFEDNKVDPPEQNIEEIKVTVKANSSEENIKDPSTGVLFSFDNNSDDGCKISIKTEDTERDLQEHMSEFHDKDKSESFDDDFSNQFDMKQEREDFQYKMPTF